MTVSKQCTVWINCLAQEVHCVSECSAGAAGDRESHQRCHESFISSRRWQREGQILPGFCPFSQASLCPGHQQQELCPAKGTEQG